MSMLTSKWHMNRLGLIDFWYYTDEEFYFKNGHMLLRGSNGSGKSVTMQSFIPLLLDGNKSSERLDPFGTRSRKIENYLIEENSERKDRIGYLYLEFKREDSDVYKTVGIGLHAKAGKPLESWYFVIEDNRRIQKDIQLIDHNLAITKQVLKNCIGEQQLIESQRAYMERVNQALFGFETIDEYKEAITLLLQLRSPKLSNSLKPTMINEILSDSLQPLSDEDLRPMSEAISNMDNIKDQLDALKLSYSSAKSVYQVFQQYSYATLFEKAHKYQKEASLLHELENKCKESTTLIQNFDEQVSILNKQYNDALREQVVLQEEKKSLGDDDMQKLSEECTQLQTRTREDSARLEKKTTQEEEKANKYQDLKRSIEKQKKESDAKVIAIKDSLKELTSYQEDLLFECHESFYQQMETHLDASYDFTYLNQQIQQKLVDLDEGIKLFQDYENEKRNRDVILDEKEKQKSKIQQEEKQLRDLLEQYDSIVEEYKERISKWMQHNQVLVMNNEQYQDMMKLLLEYDENPNFIEMNQIVMKQYKIEYTKRTQASAHLKSEHNLIHNKYVEKYQECLDWKNMEEPQPVISRAKEDNRKELKDKGIAFVPLYTLLEFETTMGEELKNFCEEAFLSIGLLDALVVHRKDKETITNHALGTCDTYIFIDQEVSSLSPQYISGTSNEEVASSVKKMLMNIGCAQYDTLQIEAEYVQSGILFDTLSKVYQATYIGKESRRIYKEKRISELEKESEELRLQAEALTQELTKTQQEMLLLEEEKESFVSELDIQEAYQQYKRQEGNVEQLQHSLLAIEERIHAISNHLQTLGNGIQSIALKLSVNANRDVFLNTKDGYLAYRQEVQNIAKELPVYHKISELIQTVQEQIDTLYDELQELHIDNETLSSLILKNKQILVQKQKQLEDMGFEKIRIRMMEVEERLQVLPDEITKLNKALATREANIANEKIALEKASDTKAKQSEIAQVYFESLLEEAELGYVALPDYSDKTLLREIQSVEKNKEINKKADDLKNDLQNVFYNHRGNMQEYHLTFITKESKIEDVSTRLDIEAKYKGSKISFLELITYLEQDISLQSNLLIDSDRHLFEDILVNIISKKVRIRIQNSKSWVDHMNKYMNTMNTSSGLKLNLQWKNKKGDTEEELDTKQLVELLEKDAGILKDEDLKKLSSHFRSKISKARILQDADDNTQSFHQLMKIVMDYRQWFEFKIMAQKTGELKKELTNNAFFAFSGGEKAMAMYIPLFSAVAAKFESARIDAPLLIALDEAFAGVDEKNIANMFALMEKFEFDYIMNSQVLWGDYATVHNLAIFELFRPENARYVTVIPYVWDGHKKRLKSESL
ncbi:MAG: TIGR02680 family protein [Longicatena sp.]